MAKRTAKKRRKPAIRTFRLFNSVWQYGLFVRIGGTSEQALNYFKKTLTDLAGPPKRFARNGAVFRCVDMQSHGMWFDDVPDAALLAHEALHSVQHVLKLAGLGPLSDDTDEAYCYLVQWTVQEIASRIR